MCVWQNLLSYICTSPVSFTQSHRCKKKRGIINGHIFKRTSLSYGHLPWATGPLRPEEVATLFHVSREAPEAATRGEEDGPRGQSVSGRGKVLDHLRPLFF